MGLQNHLGNVTPCGPSTPVNTYYGPEVTLSRKLKEAGYNPAIFKFVQAGSGLKEDWKEKGEGGLYDDMTNTLERAISLLETGGNTVNIRGFFWVQGEKDSKDNNASLTYNTRLSSLISNIRTDVKAPFLPMVLGVNEDYGSTYINRIIDAQNSIADDDENVVRSSMSELDKCDNNTHLPSLSIHAHGITLYNDYMSLVNNPSEDPDWEIVWREEFNTPGYLDENKWKINNHQSGVNWTYTGRHHEWWNPDNVSVENVGNDITALVLSAKKEDCPYPQDPKCTYKSWDDGSVRFKEHSSGEISTKGYHGNFKYGYFEARVKVPFGEGFFPSFWLSIKNDDGNTAYPPELDVFEYSGKGDYLAHGTNQRIGCNDSAGGIVDRGYYFETPSDIIPYENYRIYGMEWNEHEVKFYLDNEFVGRTLITEVPHDFLRIVLSLQLAHIPEDEDGMGNLTDENKKMYVDWVRVHKLKGAPIETDYEKWKRFWFSSDTRRLGKWDLNPGDIHVIGNFDGKEYDDVLSIAADDIHAKLHYYGIIEDNGLVLDDVVLDEVDTDPSGITSLDPGEISKEVKEQGKDVSESGNPSSFKNNDDSKGWNREWGNERSGAIGGWNLGGDVQYVSGNFDVTNDLQNPKDELLCLGNKYVKLNIYNSEIKEWYNRYGNGGDSWIGAWNTGSGDKYLVYDFNNDGSDDLLCISASSIYCKMLTYNHLLNDWDLLYENGGSSKIVPKSGNSQSWNLSTNDTYKVGDFNGNGLGELLIINAVNGCSKHYEFKSDNSGWNYVRGNGCSGALFSEWNIDDGAKYYTYESMKGNRTKLFCISPGNKYEKIVGFENNSWKTEWGNRGSYQIYNRDLVDSDQFFFGYFTNPDTTEALWVKQGWNSYYYNKYNSLVAVNCDNERAYLHRLPLTIEAKRARASVEETYQENAVVSEQSGKVKIYPNPTSSKFFIEGDGVKQVQILNMRGRVVGNVEFNAEENYGVDMLNYPTGVYFIKVIRDNKTSVHKLLFQ